jgi:uncharacterized RDD family membrane protein YckC
VRVEADRGWRRRFLVNFLIKQRAEGQLMAWYYNDNGKQTGPVDDAGLASLVASGKITSNTLVWREGMAGWEPYTKAVPSGAAAAPASGTACASCRGSFETSQMIRYGEQWVCAGCKDTFFQRMREGVDQPSILRYGGFWIRVGAKFLDGLILTIPNLILNALIMGSAIGFGAGSRESEDMVGAMIGSFVLLYALTIGLQVAYSVFFVGKFGATPGKMACGLRIVMADGGKISYGRATGRFFSEWLNMMILYIGYIMVAFDGEKRALHDRIAGTRVVYK